MTRLAQYTRDNLTSTLLRRFMDPIKEQIAARTARLAKSVLDTYIDDRSIHVQGLPTGVVPLHKEMNWTNNSGKSRHLLLEDGRVMPHALKNGDARVETIEIEAEYEDIGLLSAALSVDKDKLHQQIRATLKQFSTIGALEKGWPEAYALLGRTAKVVNLPAIPLTELNAKLGLIQGAQVVTG